MKRSAEDTSAAAASLPSGVSLPSLDFPITKDLYEHSSAIVAQLNSLRGIFEGFLRDVLDYEKKSSAEIKAKVAALPEKERRYRRTAWDDANISVAADREFRTKRLDAYHASLAIGVFNYVSSPTLRVCLHSEATSDPENPFVTALFVYAWSGSCAELVLSRVPIGRHADIVDGRYENVALTMGGIAVRFCGSKSGGSICFDREEFFSSPTIIQGYHGKEFTEHPIVGAHGARHSFRLVYAPVDPFHNDNYERKARVWIRYLRGLAQILEMAAEEHLPLYIPATKTLIEHREE